MQKSSPANLTFVARYKSSSKSAAFFCSHSLIPILHTSLARDEQACSDAIFVHDYHGSAVAVFHTAGCFSGFKGPAADASDGRLSGLSRAPSRVVW